MKDNTVRVEKNGQIQHHTPLSKRVVAKDDEHAFEYKRSNNMKKYVCSVCGYVYDPDEFDGVAFEDQPDDFVCPLCGVGKEDFEEE